VTWLIGTDEAGYGPNLGPLVISATAWHVPDRVAIDQLYQHLAPVVSPAPLGRGNPPEGRVAMADSKALYRPGNGLRSLELGLWAAMAQTDHRPLSWSEVWHALAPDSIDRLWAEPGHADFDAPLPRDATGPEVEPATAALRRRLAETGVQLREIHSRPVFAAEFNALLDRHASKGALLSRLTLQLAADLVAPLGEGPVVVVCDKHGGRNRYAALLAEHFPESLVQAHGEGRQRSVYRFGAPDRRIEWQFRTRAEACLPVALASMASKYLRELSMLALNRYWCERVEGLRPTAGYPQDARRFKAAIAAVQKQLGLDDRLIWRAR
jgi:hypothetical protein